MTDNELYGGVCPQCEKSLLGVSKQELVAHLRENGETLAAKMVENDTFVFEDCADANPEDYEGFCADATGAQRGHCPGCENRTRQYVETKVGENGTISRKRCEVCDHEWTESWVSENGGNSER